MIAAAAAAAGAGPVRALLADESPLSKSPNEKLGVAIVGVRGRGGTHIGAFAGRKDTEVLYICDVDSEIGQSRVGEIAKRQTRTPEFVTDLRKALADKRVDIVSIATPNHLHALQAIWALQHEKHVYVEKPVSHNVSEGRRLVEAAEKYGKLVQTGMQCRSNPGMIDAIEYVRSGKIGEVQIARGLCYKRRPAIGERGKYAPPASVDFDLWLGPAPKVDFLTRPQFHYDWHWQWDYGNGDLGNQGIHQMDLARWGLGVDRLPERVLSYGGRFGYVDAGETANTQIVHCDYGPQSLIFEVRGLPTGNLKGANVGVIFEGTEGYVVMTSYHSGAAFDRDGKQVRTFSGEGDHFANFLQAIRSGRRSDLNADILQGHLSSALCHLGNISYRLGEKISAAAIKERLVDLSNSPIAVETLARTVEHLQANRLDLERESIVLGAPLTLNPAEESFVKNDDANALLTREYREPFVVSDKV